MINESISDRTLERLPIYLNCLEKLAKEGTIYTTAGSLAAMLGYKEILVKKDLNLVLKEKGKPKVGHLVANLIKDISDFLGYNIYSKACLCGAGKLGEALICYGGFKKQNVEIVVAFDIKEDVVNTFVNGVPIYHNNKISSTCRDLDIHIGIITTPAEVAQEVCDKLIASGVRAIWNFAPTVLNVPDGIILRNENLAISLAYLSQKLNEK